MLGVGAWPHAGPFLPLHVALPKPSSRLTSTLRTLFPASAPCDIQRQQMEPETWRKRTPRSESIFPGAKATVLNVEERAWFMGGGWDEGALFGSCCGR